MPLMQLIFQSSLVNETETSLAQIFHACRINNKLNGITGIILCSGVHFFEVLEGENDVVMQTYQRVCADSRHRITHAWGNSDMAERQFPKWVSGFRRVKRGSAPSRNLHEAYFFDDYDISNLRENGGLIQDKLFEFHHATFADLPYDAPVRPGTFG